MDKGFKGMHGRFDKVNDRFDELNATLRDGFDAVVSSIDAGTCNTVLLADAIAASRKKGDNP